MNEYIAYIDETAIQLSTQISVIFEGFDEGIGDIQFVAHLGEEKL